MFHIDGFQAGDKYILAQDISEIILNLTDDHHPKLTQEKKHELQQD